MPVEVAHLPLEAFQQFAHPVGAQCRRNQFPLLRHAGELDLVGGRLGLMARGVSLAERGANGIADADQHRGFDHDDHGMNHDPEEVAAARIDRVREQKIQTQMMDGNQAGRSHQDRPFAKSRQHRQNREIVEVHLDLPRMPAEQEDEDRCLSGKRHGQCKADELHRPSQTPCGQRGRAQRRRGQQGQEDVAPQQPGDRAQNDDMHQRQRHQRPGDDRLKRLEIGHGWPALTPIEDRQAARSCGSTTSHAPEAIARAV